VDAITLADWGGSVAAALSIVLLFRKSPGYWYLSIVATSLWFYVFVETESAMVAGLQVSYTLFALYGIARWHVEARGNPVPAWLDHVGAAIALGILAVTVAIADFVDWTTSVELVAVALAILANWLTALKVIWCWPVWIATNVLFGVLFWHFELWGLFTMQWVYALLSVGGFVAWHRASTGTMVVRAAEAT
jgi:nicotinamide mononucleotide transporter